MAKLKSGSRVYGTLNVDTSVGLSSISLATASAGSLEYDGTSFFSSNSPTTSSGRGLILSPTIVRVNSLRTHGANNTLENIFDTANDVLNLQTNTLYWFRGVYVLNKVTSGSNNTLNIAFTFSQTVAEISYWFRTFPQGGGTTLTRHGLVTSAASTAMDTTGTTSASYTIELEGWFKSNATTGGTLTPQYTQTAGSVQPTVSANTWLMVQPITATPASTLLSGAWA